MRTLLLGIACCSLLSAADPAAISVDSLHPGLRNIAVNAYSPTFTDATVFENLWRSWDTPSREAAAKATDRDRRAMTLRRYGLVESPYENGGAPLGMIVKKDGSWAMNCLICHAGNVAGRTILGAPNSTLDFSSIYEDVAATIAILHSGKPGNPAYPQGLLFLTKGQVPEKISFPEGLLSVSRGTFNSFTFSVHFMALRDRDLNMLPEPVDLKPLNHYIDPPPLWHAAKKKVFYWDGFVAKSVRPLMQFSLDPSFGPAEYKSWESEYKEIYAWLHTIESPKYPGAIDRNLASMGRQVYTQTCSGCHGVPGPGGEYKSPIVPIGVVKTDRGRLDGLSPEFKKHFSKSWMGSYGETQVDTQGAGYVAPPLDGIWASAPYFHNGSVPTLYHVLFPDERPAVWKEKGHDLYDHARVGLLVEEFSRVPNTNTLTGKREYRDATRPTMGNGGHRFADGLTSEQTKSLLEYLKTL